MYLTYFTSDKLDLVICFPSLQILLDQFNEQFRFASILALPSSPKPMSDTNLDESFCKTKFQTFDIHEKSRILTRTIYECLKFRKLKQILDTDLLTSHSNLEDSFQLIQLTQITVWFCTFVIAGLVRFPFFEATTRDETKR